ncbi:MAG: hypothetical protein B6242_11225 [Anaerolineaceae bacterium 4572_78]|nr:MAG: hypothetical protein B6242_11225 [Anaerolineaceae bacterium 4572_78]
MKKVIVAVLLVILLWILLWLNQSYISRQLFFITGEEEPLKQFSGMVQYLFTRLQPPLQMADMVPIQHASMNPYGVNTFLQQEVEPSKREQAMQKVAEAGFHWIRQEFTWEDIEIHGKADFEDRRNEPYRSAWDKYDHIVALAEKYDVQIMARLSNPPAWSRANGNEVGAFAPPDNISDYGDFVEIVAKRYKGRVHVYQIWNEPNIYPEWGMYPIDAAEYVNLLKEGYSRIKAVDHEAIVVMGALAATIELDRQRREGISPGGLSDVLFLQQVYDNGGGDYFDVLAMQGYGLWSGPYDRRMQPRVLNFSRPMYIRDVMVRNGDAHKPIWLSELAWNAVPLDSGIQPIYGHVSPEKQATYTILAYRRIQEEWPWLGVANYWFLKQATDQELKDKNPQYFFRLLEPDLRPMPVYHALKEANNQPPHMYRGYHQENHWTVTYHGEWHHIKHADAVLGKVMQSYKHGDKLEVTFTGKSLTLVTLGKGGYMRIEFEDNLSRVIRLDKREIVINLPSVKKSQQITMTAWTKAPVYIDGFIVR